MRIRARTLVAAVLLVAVSSGADTQAPSVAITTPQQQFGAAIGDDYFLVRWAQFEEYWKTLDRESNRMSLVEIGKTEEGRSQWMAVITAPENFSRLDRYKEISRTLARAEHVTDRQARALAREGRAVVWIDAGLHADEVLGIQQLIETVYQLVSRTDAETERFLRDVIVLAVHANPDGHALVGDWYMKEPVPTRRSTSNLPRLYQKYVGHDNNRDFYMSTQAETINMNRVLYRDWFPQIVYDHHQTAPDGTVMFAPPFREPFNYLYDPLIPAGLERIGSAMHRRFAAEGKRGVTTRTGADYSIWWNGGLRTTAYFHNQIGLLTETIGHPTPVEIPFVAERQRRSADLPLPIAPQTWRFRQSIEYSVTANRAVLDVASRQRESLLYNAYRMGKNSIERGSRDSWTPYPHRPAGGMSDRSLRDPRGYILPADQPDFLTATKFVNVLIRNGIDVHRASQAFAVNERVYPADSFVVKTAQAFRPHVLDMFEPQDHPDDIPYPGGSPTPPYDSAGWTLAFQMGVKFDRVLDGFDGPFEKVTGEVPPPEGRVSGVEPAVGYLVSHHQNDAFVGVNRLLKGGEDVYWLGDRAIGGGSGNTGAMYIAARSTTRPILQRVARDLGLRFTGVSAPPTSTGLKLQAVRIGLADAASGSVSSGWTRWLLERYEFPFEVVPPRALGDDRLSAAYDVLILPDDIPLGRDATSVQALRRFAENGGTIIAVGGSTDIVERFGLGLSSALVERRGEGLVPLSREKFYVPGSILRLSVDNTTPLGYGFEREVDVFFDNSPVFRLAPDRERAMQRVAWFSGSAPLRSGWALGQEHLNGGVAVVDVALGRGRVVVCGPEMTFRAQSHGTFKFLFNAIFYGKAREGRIE